MNFVNDQRHHKDVNVNS